ncbi:unnamed protein product [Ambrosiozyma monospora]|uniref:Unnamed protein product n=1 Tax=Ambrosiozyma monospora TaxID=43982 RepID=A0ACB5U9U9_AMBMO|nr:unnamed protein product [Ambrosiozyma monospora]
MVLVLEPPSPLFICTDKVTSGVITTTAVTTANSVATEIITVPCVNEGTDSNDSITTITNTYTVGQTVTYTITSCSDHKCSENVTSGVVTTTAVTTANSIVTETVTVPCEGSGSGSDNGSGNGNESTVTYTTIKCFYDKCLGVVTSGVVKTTTEVSEGSTLTKTVTVPCENTTGSNTNSSGNGNENTTAGKTVTYTITSCSDNKCSTVATSGVESETF